MTFRVIIGIFCSVGLMVVFLFQRTDLALILGLDLGPLPKFIFNRSMRFIINDGLSIGLIYAIFRERKYLIFAIYVQLLGLLVVLVPYFILKVEYPEYNGPLINFLHRLVLNPLLLLLLIPAFYYQRRQSAQ